MSVDRIMRNPASKPMSVQDITKKAENFEYDSSIPLRYWLRTATLLLKEAGIYGREGNDQQAYLLLFRHANLFLRHLSKHPEANRPEHRAALEALERSIPKVLDRLSDLKPRIAKKYEQHQRLLQERETRRQVSATDSAQYDGEEHQTFGTATGKDSDPALAGASTTLAAGENRDLAVRLAREEIRRRDAARKTVRPAGISNPEQQQWQAAGQFSEWEEAYDKYDESRRDDLQQKMREARYQMERPRAGTQSNEAADGKRRHPSSAYVYPQVPLREGKRSPDWASSPVQQNATRTSPVRGMLNQDEPPELPAKERSPLGQYHQQALAGRSNKDFPPRPEKTPLSRSPTPDPVSRSATATPTSVADIQPSTFTFKPSAYLEDGSPLRTIFLPPHLRSTFLTVAEPNTRANLETCGVLCGTLISNALFISRLIIPEQENTSDTCETMNESALFDYCDSEDLMMLGWIHTHPSQTCFMSSRDLHTHCGYQVMMPESIAIVCAPSKSPSWGVFRLTDPPGMKAIRNCDRPGIFHPHDETNIYTDALRPGHVFEAQGLEFQVVDLRPGH